MKPHKYKGVLAEKQTPHLPPELWFETPDRKLEVLRSRQELLFDALFADCDVPRDSEDGWMRVALTLAARHIKAFAPIPNAKLGRPSQNAAEDHEITLEMARIIGTGKTTRNAAQILAKRRGKNESVGSIEQRYRRTMAEWKKAHDQIELAKRAVQRK
jgi:hypothetical protein